MNWYKKSAILDETLDRLEQINTHIVDNREIEGYDIVLTEGENYDQNYDSPTMYQIAIQREGYDFSNPQQQMEKRKIDHIPNIDVFVNELKNIITEWVQKYGRIYIGSLNTKKTPKYVSILKYLGFNLHDTIVGPGLPVSYIEG